MSVAKGSRAEWQLPGPLAEFERVEDGGVLIVGVSGELDVSNVEALAEIAYGLPNTALGLVLDLAGTSYVDSATIGLLFKLHAALRRRGQALRVVCPKGSNARRVLELTGFDQSTPPEEGREDAVAAILREVPLSE